MSKKTEPMISYMDSESIIETIYIPDKGSFFLEYSKGLKSFEIKDNIEKNGVKYESISSNSNYIKNGSVLFPSGVMDYGTKEDLLKSINGYLYKYIDIPKEYRIVCTYYILLTYVYPNFNEIPYLRVIGDYGSGKSRLLKTIGNICYTPIITNGGTSLSALFRMIEIFKGTLILDEADFNHSDTTSEVIKLLNNGYQKGNSIMRADGEKFEVQSYDIFGPKIIGGRMLFKDPATESRCLSNIMKKTNRRDLPISLDKSFTEESLILRNKLLKFRLDNYDNIKLKNELIEEIEPRLNQIINPILSIIDNVEIEKIVIKSLVEKQNDINEERRNSLFGAILSIIQIKFGNTDELYFKDILFALEDIEGKNAMNSRKLGSLLRQNRLRLKRRNKGTVIEKHINTEELDRLYKEYSIS